MCLHHVVTPSLAVYPPIGTHVVHIPIQPEVHRSILVTPVKSRQFGRCEIDHLSSKGIQWMFVDLVYVWLEVWEGVEVVCPGEEVAEKREE